MEYILGKPQSQKSMVLREMALQVAAKSPFSRIWYLVPEQYTLQTQRELIRQNNYQGLLNLEVLSFNRLVYRLQNELQTAGKVALKGSGKAALIYRILCQQSERFPVLAKKRNSLAFIQNLATMITECYQYRMSPEILKSMADELSGELIRDKTKDLAELLAVYQDIVKTEYFMIEAALAEVSEALKKMDLSDTEIFVDGFYGFVPMQIEILSTLIEQAKDVHIAFPYARRSEKSLGLEDLRYPSELYFDVKNSISKLRATYPPEKERITIIDQPLNRVSPEIFKIEDELFQLPKQPATSECQHIHMAEAGTAEEELRYIAEEILTYIYEKGYRFSDIAVLAGNLEEYAAKVERIFTEYRLVYFLDRKQKIRNHPLLLFVESALLAVRSNFRYEEVMPHLKNIYIYPDVTDPLVKAGLEDEISVLDIYALEHGLQGRRSYAEIENKSEELNQIFEDLFCLSHELKRKSSFSAKLEALQVYLNRRAVFANLQKQVVEFEEKSDWVRVSEYRQVSEKLQQYFAEMKEFMELGLTEANTNSHRPAKEPEPKANEPAKETEPEPKANEPAARAEPEQKANEPVAKAEPETEQKLLKSEEISVEEFISILLSGMQELEYAAAPPVPDQIVVGNLEHTRLSKTKIIFAIGLSEGNVPSIQADSGFFSDWERQSLKSIGGTKVSLAEDRKTSIFKAQLTIFMGLLNATEHLYFSYARSSADGKNLRPANLFYQICRMFPQNPVRNLSTWWKEHQRVTYPLPTLYSFMKQLQAGGNNSDFLPIYQSLYNSEVAEAMERLLEPAFMANEEMDAELAGRLYQNQRRMSISRLESYSACPFLHFIRYGIKAREIVPYQAARVDMGVFLHKVMEVVFSLCRNQKKQIFELTEEEYHQVLQTAVKEGLASDKRSIFEGNARNRFLAERLTDIADRAVRTVQKQLQQGEMSVYQEEIRFRRENMANLRFFTEDGEEFYLEGVIDRMDTSREGDIIYFSILDYKTSEHNLDYTEIFYGLQLQLLIYLKAGQQYLQSADQRVIAKPVSAAYFHMKNPMFGQTEVTGESIPKEEDFLKEMRLKGVFVAETLPKMDKALAEGNQSLVMNIRLKNDGTPYSNAMVLPAAELSELEDFAKQKAEQIADDIWQGGAEIKPYYYGKRTPCTYCQYAGICKVDLKENPYRYLRKKEKADVLGKVADKKK
ncbi:hypothetical protein EII17_09020 [Clostridiales bacterium COT073_COT-073]|nr:hypothetical protein EII17_09020 [Clostridiales bacterium COT073_COT-073]